MTAQTTTRPRKRKVDALTALEHKQAGLTYKEIGKLQGVSKQAVHQAISTLLPSEDTENYKKHRSDIFADLQMRILNQIDDDTLKGMVERRGLVDLGILYDKERIERGLGDSDKQPMVIINSIRIDAKPVDNSQIVDVNEINPLNNVVKSIT